MLMMERRKSFSKELQKQAYIQSQEYKDLLVTQEERERQEKEAAERQARTAMISACNFPPLALRIAGDIAMSQVPSERMMLWREFFGVSARVVSLKMKVSGSVVSDYERKGIKPRANFLKRFVYALMELNKG